MMSRLAPATGSAGVTSPRAAWSSQCKSALSTSVIGVALDVYDAVGAAPSGPFLEVTASRAFSRPHATSPL